VRQFGAEQPKNEWIGRLSHAFYRCVGSLIFQATQTSAINAFGSSPMGAQPSSAIRSLAKFKTIEKADEKEAQRGA
jgi:hypothetical protein